MLSDGAQSFTWFLKSEAGNKVLAIRDSYHYIPRDSSVNWGMGQVVPTMVSTIATTAATGFATTASILFQLGMVSSTIPIVGVAIAALVAVGIALANVFKGCGQTCVQATAIANQCDTLLVQNVTAYTSSPIRYASMQTAALNTFDTTWAALQQACGASALGAAGQRCITDRQRGACTWKASQGGWNADGTFTPWGAAGSGSTCWNWFVGMRDPIANDPNVQPDPTSSSLLTGSAATSTIGTGSSSTSTSPDLTELLIGAALLAAAVLL
jgi:hypothetical protein